MSTKLLVVAALTFSLAVSVLSQDQTGDPQAMSDIKAVVSSMESGWNRKSGAEFAKPFSADANFVVMNGMKVTGRVAIAERHQGIFDTIFKKSSLKLDIEKTRFLNSHVAILHLRSELAVGEGNSIEKISGRITLVMSRSRERWEIVAFQITQIRQ